MFVLIQKCQTLRTPTELFSFGLGSEQQKGQVGHKSYQRVFEGLLTIEGLSERLHRNMDTIRCHNAWFKDTVNIKLQSSHLSIIQLNFGNYSKMLDLSVETHKYFWKQFLGLFSFFQIAQIDWELWETTCMLCSKQNQQTCVKLSKNLYMVKALIIIALAADLSLLQI